MEICPGNDAVLHIPPLASTVGQLLKGFDRKLFHSSPFFDSNSTPFPKVNQETHLWYEKPSEVKSESLLNQYLDIIPPCEKQNELQMRGEELRKSALLARALIRTTIARCKF
ncbi:hypothetical protein ACJIZ3_010954 [Penstemon smallii]|uniref:Uncharacterized protein n=1 Tax=Penstemon smallii TaxID=265156 RepID=A0ABD3UJ73_9LAMI